MRRPPSRTHDAPNGQVVYQDGYWVPLPPKRRPSTPAIVFVVVVSTVVVVQTWVFSGVVLAGLALIAVVGLAGAVWLIGYRLGHWYWQFRHER